MTVTTLKCMDPLGVARASGLDERPSTGPPPARPRTPFWEGALASVPLWLYVAPLGLVFGLSAHEAGLGMPEAVWMSGDPSCTN